MRMLSAITLLVTVALTGPAGADQTDPRLDDLFAELKAAADPQTANRFERTIWSIWYESEDPAVRILMELGTAAMARSDHRAALGKFDQVVAIAPDFAEGWNKRATLYYLLGDYHESLADIDRTLDLEPRHFGALAGRGLVYIELNEEELALESFEAALGVHPALPGARHNAAALRRRLKNREI